MEAERELERAVAGWAALLSRAAAGGAGDIGFVGPGDRQSLLHARDVVERGWVRVRTALAAGELETASVAALGMAPNARDLDQVGIGVAPGSLADVALRELSAAGLQLHDRIEAGLR